MVCLSLLFVASVKAEDLNKSVLVMKIEGENGESIESLNAILKQKGEANLLPEYLELTSEMTSKDILKIEEDFDALAGKVKSGKRVVALAYDEEQTCFKGSNKKVEDIYANMVDIFVSDQFTIYAAATRNPDKVGIKYDQSDSGDQERWLNLSRCK